MYIRRAVYIFAQALVTLIYQPKPLLLMKLPEISKAVNSHNTIEGYRLSLQGGFR